MDEYFKEGMAAWTDGLDITDCPYDSFDQSTENKAMEWINGYNLAPKLDHDHAPE